MNVVDYNPYSGTYSVPTISVANWPPAEGSTYVWSPETSTLTEEEAYQAAYNDEWERLERERDVELAKAASKRGKEAARKEWEARMRGD